MGSAVIIIGTALGIALLFGLLSLRRLIYICAPNEVLIFSGKRRRVGDRTLGYKLIKGGRGFRIPLVERVDKMDLTNMIIDMTAANAYSKGGVPLTVQGVANVKVAGHEPVLNNAVERFLGKGRGEIMQIAKSTLEGSLRGICATMTPEQINEDKILFAERLVQEVEDDMTKLGLVIDTFKIQNVQDDVQYLDSIGRKKNAEVLRTARIAEAIAQADAAVNAAENREREMKAKITADTEIAKADAARRLKDAQTRRGAVVAEEQATVAAALAQAKAEIGVQIAQVEQTRSRLEADVVQPAKAEFEAAVSNARGLAAPIIADGEARAVTMETLAKSWKNAGAHAGELFLLQKLEKVIASMTDVVSATEIGKVTMIDTGISGDSWATKAFVANEQSKATLGVDFVDLLKRFSESKQLPQEKHELKIDLVEDEEK